MSLKILQINFNYVVSTAELEEAFTPAAGPIAAVPGLRWKTWLVSEDRREAGGIYLFDNDASLQAFLAGPIAAGLNAPMLSNVSVKVFDIMLKQSAVTRAPLMEVVPV